MNEEILELKKEIERLKKAVKEQRYGLNWIDVPEAFEDDVENKLPILKEAEGNEIINNDTKPTHILIEGDNYHALTCLNYTHREKIDFIYIDPPYNTGNDGFVYKDKRILDRYPDGSPVPKDNPFRHSYWLSFMKKRLELAKTLLKETGVIFISIDNNEISQLKLLCDEIFGEDNFESFIWKKKGGAGNTERIIGNLTEYILCYFKNKKPGIFNYRTIERVYKHKDGKGPYNLEGIEKTNLGGYERKTMQFPIVDPKTKKKFFPGTNMRWTIGEKNAKKAIEQGRIYFDYKKSKVYIIKRPKDYEESENVFYNLLLDAGSLATAKDELYDFFGNREIFDTPKPTSLIRQLLEIASSKNHIVLDFFAGSGTTAQAVLELNEVDNGERQFIVCTDNENNICQKICYPRIKKVINGYLNPDGEKVKGLGNSLKYYKTNFIGKHNIKRVIDEDKVELAYHAGELLAVAENTLYKVSKNRHYQFFKTKSNANEHYTGVYFREELNKFDEFVKRVEKLKSLVTVYVFSWGQGEFIDEFSHCNNVTVKNIPLPILAIYKEIYNLH
ncbi:MAG: site-specific DNA-methyltransferase [Candidatus Omnitrophica bacterium]|nr:site-specific DNA-methyltransferase [Candidatus Omnitrophota bacterium]